MEDLPWLPAFCQIVKRDGGYISVIVNSEEELSTLLENHKRVTLTHFNKWSSNAKDKEKLRLLWQVEDYSEDTPLCIVNRDILDCQHGRAPAPRPTAEQENPTEHVHPAKKKKYNVQKRKKVEKVGCPAKLFIRHVKRYDTFSVKGEATRPRKEAAMKRLKEELAKGNPETSTFIHVRIPLVEAHQNHTLDQGCCFGRRIHPKVRAKIQETVELGITSVNFVRQAIQEFVSTDLCAKDLQKPHKDDQAYFPPDRIIQNHIYTTLEKIKSAQLKMREELKMLTAETYLCEDLETLRRSTEELINLRKSFVPDCKLGNHMVLPIKGEQEAMLRKDSDVLQAVPVNKQKSGQSKKRTWKQGTSDDQMMNTGLDSDGQTDGQTDRQETHSLLMGTEGNALGTSNGQTDGQTDGQETHTLLMGNVGNALGTSNGQTGGQTDGQGTHTLLMGNMGNTLGTSNGQTDGQGTHTLLMGNVGNALGTSEGHTDGQTDGQGSHTLLMGNEGNALGLHPRLALTNEPDGQTDEQTRHACSTHGQPSRSQSEEETAHVMASLSSRDTL